MNDSISKELVEVDVLGRKFKFKELTGGEMDAMLDKAMKVDAETGAVGYSIAEQNKVFLSCVVEAPYDEFKQASDKIEFLNNLKSPIRSGLIAKVRQYHDTLACNGEALKK